MSEEKKKVAKGGKCKCKKEVKEGEKAMLCEGCDIWFHLKCIGMSSNLYEALEEEEEGEEKETGLHWYCEVCDVEVRKMMEKIKELEDKHKKMESEVQKIVKGMDEMIKREKERWKRTEKRIKKNRRRLRKRWGNLRIVLMSLRERYQKWGR